MIEILPAGFGERAESYSSFTTWLECGEKYRLRKLEHVQELPAWWSIGGSAVHGATEDYDRALHAAEGR